MKKLKRMVALVIAMAMVLGTMIVPAMAEVPTDGSITVNSPVVEATYNVYKVFDMTTNDGTTAFSYTIDTNSAFYNAVVAYATHYTETDSNNNPIYDYGLTLTEITPETTRDSNGTITYAKYNVTASDDFDAKAFGKFLQIAMAGGQDAVTADPTATPPVEAQDAIPAASPTAAADAIKVTAADAKAIKFDELALGYYLVAATYPKVEATASLTLEGVVEADWNENNHWTFTADELANGELTSSALDKIDAYVDATVTENYVKEYVNSNPSQFENKSYDDLTAAEKTNVTNQLKDSTKESAVAKVSAAINKMQAEGADINVKEPILVFLDSSQPDAVINEKNEIDKWDTPVNPDNEAELTDVPEHGEPDGGKNIVVNEDPVVYADWSEAEIGESIHYQLRVNAMNFIRTGDSADSVEQVKEWFLADYQNSRMHYDTTKGIHVSVWAGNDENNSQKDQTNVTSNVGMIQGVTYNAEDKYLDYSSYANTFFKNTSQTETVVPKNNDGDDDVFGEGGTGIVVPWVTVSDTKLSEQDYPVYTVSKYETGEYEPWDGQDQTVSHNSQYLTDENGDPIPVIGTKYVHSIYSSDVTIVVDYWMILDDDAVVDGAGNTNYAQYAYMPVEPENAEPKTPVPGDKPDNDHKKDVDKATVYTYALAFVKVDKQANALANATFKLPFYVKADANGNPIKADGTVGEKGKDPYIYAFKELGENDTYPEDKSKAPDQNGIYPPFTAANSTNTLVSPVDGVITITGVEQGTYSITETEAPVGYNKLAAPFDVEAKKTGEAVITETTHTIYLDENGNVTEEETETKVTKHTTDNNVPVYEFKPVVNQTGSELPSTGGIGTTIFYVVGTILVIGAGVVLITRRRMDA